ncbi:putative secreted protein [Lunatimonas lonarensis]|uniref:Putative secreted protein n=1 Tax=Lunatimonas lonarensis TaxID=1232681 RepID=R7ZX79_9BACT|nr:endonuclease/exonuclease/phosphatase family protein [Lunatimonas lonarensis]EON78771.1 putative secreted protein [Lunatimonas lonarensis]
MKETAGVFSFFLRPFFGLLLSSLFLICGIGIMDVYAQQISVLSYNIHHCNPPSQPGLIDVEAIARVIRDSGADLVALQEVDVFTERSGRYLHQAARLGELTEMYWYFYKSIDHAGGEYGNAILSKYPILAKGGWDLPNDADTEPRTAVYVDVMLPGGGAITFAGTHLEFKREEVTLKQAKSLAEFLGARSDRPLILAGDFNSEAGKSPINFLDKMFLRSCLVDCAPTIPEINPVKEIDFVMVRPKDAFRIISHEVITETYASDHLPVLVRLILN